MDFDLVMERLTYVTDCPAFMLTVVDSSASTTDMGWNEFWSPCMVHMLNTVMEKVMKEAEKIGNLHFTAM